MNVVGLTWAPLIKDTRRGLDHQSVITFDRALLKRRHEQPALLLMLRTVHAGQTKANALLGRAVRTANQLAGCAKSGRIAEYFPIELWTHDEQARLARLPKQNRADEGNRAVAFVALPHRGDRIVKEVIVFARGGESGNWFSFHAKSVAQMPGNVWGKGRPKESSANALVQLFGLLRDL
jgi:hypothetical protein